VFSQSQGSPLPRNFFRGPDLLNIDAAIRKQFSLSESRRLEFAVEMFNVANHANFANPVNSLSSPAFGRLVSTSTRARELQLSLKFLF
jgi:hypothetical protein